MGPEVADLWVAGIWIHSDVFKFQMQLLRTSLTACMPFAQNIFRQPILENL